MSAARDKAKRAARAQWYVTKQTSVGYRDEIAAAVRKLIDDMKARGEAFTPYASQHVAEIVRDVMKTNRGILRLTGKVIHGSHVIERVDEIGACKLCCHAFVGDEVADELLAPCVPVSEFDRAWARMLEGVKAELIERLMLRDDRDEIKIEEYKRGADFGARVCVRWNTEPRIGIEMSISKACAMDRLDLEAYARRFVNRFAHAWIEGGGAWRSKASDSVRVPIVDRAMGERDQALRDRLNIALDVGEFGPCEKP